MNASATLDDLRPRKPGGLSRAALLALIAHVLLLIGLSLGVSWRSSEPAGVEAELWAAVPQVAAPPPVQADPPPPPKPVQKTEPKVEPKVEPPPNRDADIAREKREQQQRLEQQREEQQRKQEAERKKQERAEAEQRKAEDAKREAERQKKTEAAEAARLDKLRQDNLRRLNAQVAGDGAPDSTGSAARSAGPSASYAGRIKARIKPNIVFADDAPGNPLASVEVKVAPDGTIVGRRLVKSSGVAAWDDAVLRAIDKTEVLPRDTDGRVPPAIVIDFRPRDL